jgi:cytochrome bd ubiquinol oxidase subunit I
VRFPHMLLATYITGSFCVAATGAWYVLGERLHAHGTAMLRMGLGLAAVLVPLQLLFGHLAGDFVHDKQPAKFAAIEARWHDEKPAAEVIVAFPDEATESNHWQLAVPILGSLIATMHWDSKEVGLTDFPKDERPPVLIPFIAFRLMVGCGLIMLALAWYGTWLAARGRLYRKRWLLWAIFLSFPLGFIATLTGWFTSEVGRQPWIVYGQLKTAEGLTPSLSTQEVAFSLVLFAAIYLFIFLAGMTYIYRLLSVGPGGGPVASTGTNPKRPLSVPGESPGVLAQEENP